MLRFYELVSAVPLDELQKIKDDIRSGVLHPMEAKKRLAAELVDRFCKDDISSTLAAAEAQDTASVQMTVGQAARQEFEKVFSKKDLPDDIPVAEIAWEGEAMKLVRIIALAMSVSNSEARRLIQQGGVEVDQQPVKDVDAVYPAAGAFILRVGKKRFVKVVPKR